MQTVRDLVETRQWGDYSSLKREVPDPLGDCAISDTRPWCFRRGDWFYKRSQEGVLREAIAHELYNLFHDEPWPYFVSDDTLITKVEEVTISLKNLTSCVWKNPMLVHMGDV